MIKRITRSPDIKKLSKLISLFNRTITKKDIELTLKNPDYRLFISEDYLGMGVVFFINDFGRILCEIQDMVVLPKYRRRGIGTEIMNALINEVKSESKKCGFPIHIYLTSNIKRKEANNLYKKVGFKQIAYGKGKNGTNLYKLIIKSNPK